MKYMRRAFVLSVLCLFAAVSHAGGDVQAGKSKAVICAACHGGKGISPTGAFPNLAGQKEEYLITQITAFRDGVRESMQMAPMVSRLSDQDILNLAAYYASLSCN